MFTLFAVPKAFSGHAAIIQTNAIRSWTLLNPRPAILLFTAEEDLPPGVETEELTVVRDFQRNLAGTPLLNDIFNIAAETGGGSPLCYINSDIILMSDFVAAASTVINQYREFLMIGQRHDLWVDHLLTFSELWESNLCETARREGARHPPSGLDYFLFRSDRLTALPAFAVGRAAWDNWFVKNALRHRIPVVDATEAVLAIHQNHDYSHIKGGASSVRQGAEANLNKALAGEDVWRFTVQSANRILTPEGHLRVAFDKGHRRGRILAWRSRFPLLDRVAAILGTIRRRISAARIQD